MSEKLSIEIAEHAAQLTASGQERQHDLYTRWAQWARELEAKLEAMERRVRTLSRVMGSGLAYVEELRTDAGAEQRTWSRRREMWYESLAAAQEGQ